MILILSEEVSVTVLDVLLWVLTYMDDTEYFRRNRSTWQRCWAWTGHCSSSSSVPTLAPRFCLSTCQSLDPGGSASGLGSTILLVHIVSIFISSAGTRYSHSKSSIEIDSQVRNRIQSYISIHISTTFISISIFNLILPNLIREVQFNDARLRSTTKVKCNFYFRIELWIKTYKTFDAGVRAQHPDNKNEYKLQIQEHKVLIGKVQDSRSKFQCPQPKTQTFTTEVSRSQVIKTSRSRYVEPVLVWELQIVE